MDIRYKLINNQLAYTEIWIRGKSTICVHQGYVGTEGKYHELEKNNLNVVSEYSKLLSKIENAGFEKKTEENFKQLIIQVDLGFPIPNSKTLHVAKGIQNLIHENLIWSGNGESKKYDLLEKTIVYHLKVIDKDIAQKTLSKKLDKYPISNYFIAKLEKTINKWKIIYPQKSRIKTFDSYHQLDENCKQSIDIFKLVKVEIPMNENLYWEIIQKSRKNTFTIKEQETFLALKLTQLSLDEIASFYLRTYLLVLNLDTPLIACADFLINRGSGDDGFTDFRRWIVSRGKKIYYESQKNIDVLEEETDKNWDHHSFESFGYVANDAFEIKSGKDLFSYIGDLWEIKKEENTIEKQDFEKYMKLVQKDTLKKNAPKLFEKFWQKYEKDRHDV